MTERRLSDSLFAVAAVWIVLSMFTFGLFVFAAVFVLPFVALALIVWGATKYFKYKAEVDIELAKQQVEIEKNNTTLAKLENLQPVPEPQDFAQSVTLEYAKYAEPHPLPAIIDALHDATRAIYADQDLAPRKITPKSNDAYDIAKWRDDVRRLAERNTDEIIPLVSKAFADMFHILHRHLPAPAVIADNDEWIASMQPREDKQIEIPLYAAIKELGNAVEEVIYPFFRDETTSKKIFQKFRNQITANLCEASKLPDTEESLRSPKIIYPGKSTLTGKELVHTYLKNTPLEDIFTTPIPFNPPMNTRFSGHWIVAPPHAGKTVLLSTMFLEDAKRDDATVIVLDSKGDLSNRVRTLAEFKDRLVVLEPDERYPLALNPLEIGATTTHTVELLEYLFSALLDTKQTPLQATLFRSILLLLKAVPNASFADFRRVLIDGHKPYEKHMKVLHPDDRDFFTKGTKEQPAEFYSQVYKETKAQLLWRLKNLTTRVPVLRSMLGAPRLLIDMGKLMDSKKIVVIDNSKKLLGDDGSEFFGRFFIALVRAAADQRSTLPDEQKVPVFFYIDEAHNVIAKDDKIASILQECRSQKIALIMAHQAFSQIISPITKGALADCALRYANSDEEAPELSSRLRTTPEFLRSLPTGTFAAYIRGYTERAVAIRIPHTRLEDRPQLSADEVENLKINMRNTYCLPLSLPTPEEEDDVHIEQPLGDITARAE